MMGVKTVQGRTTTLSVTKSRPNVRASKKGQSGNKKGRPKSSKTSRPKPSKSLTETVRVLIGDRPVRVSKHRALLIGRRCEIAPEICRSPARARCHFEIKEETKQSQEDMADGG